MFDIWLLRWQRYGLSKKFERKLADLEKGDAPGDEFHAVDADRYFELADVDNAIDYKLGRKLLDQARVLDVDLPPRSDATMWTRDDQETGPIWLTPKGRSSIRKAIDEEIGRRRERKAWWWKTVIIPAITALTGLAGVITGLIAVLKR